MARIRTIVTGGGISGLMAARALQDQGVEYILLERCPSLGGLTRTVDVAEFAFDYTGHFLHLSKWKSPAEIPLAGLKNDDWLSIQRVSRCYVAGKMVTAPIQYNLGELPANELEACVRSFDSRPVLSHKEDISFRKFIVSGFGQYLADLFLIPQNEKTMCISLDRLSVNAVKRFFPPPDEKRVRAGINGGKSAQEYNSTFWYPKCGGIELLVRSLAANVKNIYLNQDVVGIDLRKRYILTRSGDNLQFDSMITSMPLIDLLRICNDPELAEIASHLTHSSTISINIGIRGELAPALRDVHWIYVPDRNIPFYRVGCYSNISSGCCSFGYHALYVEVGVPGEEIDHVDILNDLEPRVFRTLESLGWLDVKRVVCNVTHVIRCAYVHHTPERETIINKILKRLENNGIFPIGRYGLWDYTGMEDSMANALETVDRIRL